MSVENNPTSQFPESVSPVQPIVITERIDSLDVLRGVAVLGILLMNIVMFSMPSSTYFNPAAYGDLNGINFWTWLLSSIFADLKFMSIFSMLFGAGIVLFCTRKEELGVVPKWWHRRRMSWLLLFGVLHAVLLWEGDILIWYAMAGTLAYLFWRMTPRLQFILAISFLFVGTVIYFLAQLSMPFWPTESLEGNSAHWSPSSESIQQTIASYRGSWFDQMAERLPLLAMMQFFGFPFFGVWRIVGLMLLGMAFFKWGILSAKRSDRFYLTGAMVGLVSGLPIVSYGSYQNYAHSWAYDYAMFGGSLYNYWGSLGVSFAYICIIMLICRSNSFAGFRLLIAPVGQMAFSAYILQTLICTTIFYGHGLGLYAKVERGMQQLIVLGVWGIVIIFCLEWRKRYQYGPLEWIWRSLTYKVRQPIRHTQPKENGTTIALE